MQFFCGGIEADLDLLGKISDGLACLNISNVFWVLLSSFPELLLEINRSYHCVPLGSTVSVIFDMTDDVAQAIARLGL